MTISRNIRIFIGFAIVILLDIVLTWLFGDKPDPNWMIDGLFMEFVLVIAAIGMVWFLMRWLISGVIEMHRAKRTHYKSERLV
jgi:hypothetical protein